MRTNKKKENKEPVGEEENEADSTLTPTATTKTTTKPQLNSSTMNQVKQMSHCKKTKKSGTASVSSMNSGTSSCGGAVNRHIRSIKELSSILNSSNSNLNSSGLKCYSNRKITDYFQIRKSTRKCKSDLDKERKQYIEEAIKHGKEDGLEVRVLENKGRAVFATRNFSRGEFVCEYAGEMISYQLAKKREEMYAQDETIGCYMYFFEYKSKSYCIDATSETSRLGRLLNHSKLEGNCQAKLFETDTRPFIILVAARDIATGEEMTYDYGDRNKVSLAAHPWLATWSISSIDPPGRPM